MRIKNAFCWIKSVDKMDEMDTSKFVKLGALS